MVFPPETVPFFTVTEPPASSISRVCSCVFPSDFFSVCPCRSSVMAFPILTFSVRSAVRSTVSPASAASMAACRVSYFLPFTDAAPASRSAPGAFCSTAFLLVFADPAFCSAVCCFGLFCCSFLCPSAFAEGSDTFCFSFSAAAGVLSAGSSAGSAFPASVTAAVSLRAASDASVPETSAGCSLWIVCCSPAAGFSAAVSGGVTVQIRTAARSMQNNFLKIPFFLI